MRIKMGDKCVLSDRDMLELNRINRQQKFDIEEIDNCIGDHIIRDGQGDMIAYGIIKHFAEASILIDIKRSKNVRMDALKSMLEVAESVSRAEKIDQLHIFVKDSNLAYTLKKHYGYRGMSDIQMLKDIK